MNDCIFCKILSGEIPSYKIYETDKAYAFLDIACDAVGHTLVIPKKHFASILDCDADYLDAVIEAVKRISRHYVEDCGYDGVNVFNASGAAAEQSVFHLHFHIVPRKDGDGMSMWPLSVKRDIDLAEICKKLAL